MAQPDRNLALLWRNHRPLPPATRGAGRRPSLDVNEVVATGIRLADSDGLAAASMGGVAKELGVGTMTLYTYVPSKDELLELMVDQVLGERELPGPGEPRSGDWRAQVQLYSDRTQLIFKKHPWLSQVSPVRPPAGPGLLAAREYLLAVVSTLGLTPHDTNTAALAISTYVDSAARLQAESVLIERASGQSHDAWWIDRSDLWETYFDVDRHPAMTAIWNAGGFSTGTNEVAAEAYRYGLDRLLDGIAAGA